MLQKHVTVPTTSIYTSSESLCTFLMVLLTRSNDKRVECRIDVEMARFTPKKRINKAIKKLLQRLKKLWVEWTQ